MRTALLNVTTLCGALPTLFTFTPKPNVRVLPVRMAAGRSPEPSGAHTLGRHYEINGPCRME